jgi:DNA primase
VKDDDFKHLIEEIKDKTDIVQIIGERVRLGRNNMARCPFHDDKTPSFSVNPKGQYFHCFGCGAGGDVIDFLMRFERIGFMDALKRLAIHVGIEMPDLNDQDRRHFEENQTIHSILAKTVLFYHEGLTAEVRRFLAEERGFTEETISIYQIGFANGGLKDYLVNECKFPLDICLKARILKRDKNEKVTDYFYNRIIFPNIRHGHVVHMTGRALGNGIPKYLNLLGKIEYLYNEDALCEEKIIIAEGVPDCLSAVQMGCPAVAVYGVTQFNEDYKDRFSRCQTVYVCMDGDDAGRKAAQRIAEVLCDKAIIVQLPDGCDLNDFARKNTKEAFQKLLDGGRPFLELEIERIKALPENQRLGCLQHFLPALKNLHEFRRSHYSDIISREFSISKRTIDKGIDQETLNVSGITDSIHTPSEPPYTEEEKERAIELLKDRNLLEKFNQITEELGCVGEINNKLMIFLTLTSRILEDPINLIVKGDSSGGKSFLVDQVTRFFPKEDIKAFTAMTPKALFHRKDDLSHKALIIFERSGAEESDYSIRSLQSEKKLIISMPVKNNESGRLETQDIEIGGPIAYIETTTKTHLHSENETRCFDIYIDDSEDQTRKIHNVQRRKYKVRGQSNEVDLRRWIVAQLLLRQFPVDIPFVDHIGFPTKPLRARRDFQRFLTLIEISAILHQYQRQRKTAGEIEYLIADIEDYAIAYNLASSILQQIIKQISPRAEKLIGLIKELVDKQEDRPFTRRQIEDYIKWERKTVTKYLKECEGQGFIEISEGGRGTAYKYKFIRLPDDDDNILLHPNELKRIIEEDEQSRLSKPVQKADGQVNLLIGNALTEPVHVVPGNKGDAIDSEKTY